jgi:predicted Zn-dependent protease
LALAYLGDIALKNSEVENAGTLLEKSLQHKNDLRIAYFDLGAVRMAQKNYPATIKALKRAIELDPTQPDAHYRLGRVYRALGKTAETEAEFAATKSLHQKADAAVVLERAVPQPTAH